MFKQNKNVSVVKAGGERGSYLRLLAVVDVTKPLPRVANLRLHNTQVRASFQYERLVNNCFYCGIIGHLERGCPKKMDDIDKGKFKEGQYGEWLRAMDNAGSSRFSSSFSAEQPSSDSPSKMQPSSQNNDNLNEKVGHISAGSGVHTNKDTSTNLVNQSDPSMMVIQPPEEETVVCLPIIQSTPIIDQGVSQTRDQNPQMDLGSTPPLIVVAIARRK
ncbi:Unknown protein [Striga hermonthica]|uniref:CCHC-type domain-containing protein n=1 Tax=Striga hermonthica TaxID=68872 RepID=A0A9N7R497_STRHE|nr:Unknown protein [Striga hermonthica]